VSFLLFALLALGQATLMATEISGSVRDPTGAVVPEAHIALRSQNGKHLADGVSNQQGNFHFNVPTTGPIVIEIEHQGFKTFVATILQSSVHPKPIIATLQVSDLAQRTEVTAGSDIGTVSVDPAENRDAAVVDSKALEHLPVFDQDYVSTLSNFLDQGSVGTLGTTIVVDGMEQKDAGVTPSAVENVKINNDPYSAEYSRPGRGRIEITTKSPDPVYHGTFNFIFRDYHLDARNAFAAVKPPEQRRIFEGALTGPLAHVRNTFFLLSADYQQDNIQSIVFAQLPSGLLQENVPSPARATDIAARVRHDFSDRHTVSLQLTYEGRKFMNQLVAPGQSVSAAQPPGTRGSNQTQVTGGYVLPEAGQNISNLERHLTFSDKFVVTPNVLNQFQMMYEHNRDSTASNTEQPQINVQNAFVAGGAQVTRLATENNVDIRDVVTWSHESHTVSAGFAMPNLSRRALDDYSNRLGTFNFSSLQDYIAALPYSFTQQQGPTHFVYWMREVGGFVQDQIRISPYFQATFGVRWDWQNQLHDDDNFAPRASLAYAFGKKRDTVLRVGSGIFYDRTGNAPLQNLALYSAPALTSILLLNPAYPNPYTSGFVPRDAASNVYRLSPTIRTPYTIQYSAALEHQIFKNATVTATYRGMTGVALFTDLNVNQPLPPFYLTAPNPNIGVYQQIQSSGHQVGQALDLSFSGRINRYLSGIAQYTLSRTNNNTGGITYMPPNAWDLQGEYSRADFDQRNRFNMLVSTDVNRWAEFGIGLSAASGLPYTLTLGQDIYNSGFANARPPGIGRNTLQGPGYVELDVRWSHDFFLSAKKEKGPLATLAIDAFNLPNHVNFSQYIGNESSPFFGKAVAALPARRLQFTLRFKF
jgi:hypothetical protein